MTEALLRFERQHGAELDDDVSIYGRYCDDCGFHELAVDVDLLVEHRECPMCAGLGRAA